jgi:hypothetical protein
LKLWIQLDDLVFAEDLALLLHNYSKMQHKTTHLETSAGTGLKINRKKTKLMNTTVNTPIKSMESPSERWSFFYLGSVVDKQRASSPSVTARIDKARGTSVEKVWASKQISIDKNSHL